MHKSMKGIGLCALALSLGTSAALAQNFPSRTIRLVSGVTPGSASDTTARIIAEKLQASLGQPVIVENKLGVGGLIGAAYVANAEPDGHMISIYTSAFTVAPLLSPGPLDPKDLAPVATIGTVPTVLVVSTARSYKTVADLVAAARAKPGGIIATTAGIGSSTHMNLERFRIAAGIEVLHVPMKGAPDALTEVLTGRADSISRSRSRWGRKSRKASCARSRWARPRGARSFPTCPPPSRRATPTPTTTSGSARWSRQKRRAKSSCG